jgi:hypothetical protein
MIEIERKQLPSQNGYDLTLVAYYDQDITPDEFDCYTAKQTQAWKEELWHYVTLEVCASRSGIALGQDFIGGVEFGWIPITDENDNQTGEAKIDLDSLASEPYAYLNDLISQAIDEAELKLQEISQ